MNRGGLRKEAFVQFSGYLNRKMVSLLKECDYYIVDIPLDGEAPQGKRIITPIKIGKRGLTFHEKLPWRRPRTSSAV